MKLIFVFFLTTYGPTENLAYVEGHNLTGAECITLMELYNTNDPEWSRGVPSCEIDPNGIHAAGMGEMK